MLMSVPMSCIRGEERQLTQSEILQFIFRRLKYIATRGHYITTVVACKDEDVYVDEE